MPLSEEDVRAWRDRNMTVFERAIAEVERLVKFFLDDWAATWEFSYEQVAEGRVKDAPRIHAKALRRGIDDADQLLERSYRNDERDRFPVHDLLGVRVLVLSLNHVA